MKFGIARLLAGTALALALGSVAEPAKADGSEWSTWRSFGGQSQMSVSFLRVNRDTYTWKFRNDGNSSITYMRFEYTDTDGAHEDTLPGTLRPHAAIGGWAAFTAVSNPTIKLLEVDRE